MSSRPEVRILYESGGVTKVHKSFDSWVAANYSKLYRQFHDRFSYHSKKVEDHAAYPQYVTLQKGTYTIIGFDGFDITITVKSNDGFMLSLKDFDYFSDTLISDIKQARKRGLQYHKPNLPQESKEIDKKHDKQIEESVYSRGDASNFDLDDENDISTIRLLEIMIKERTGWEPYSYLTSDEEEGCFAISWVKGTDAYFIESNVGPDSEFWVKIEEFIKEFTIGDYGDTKPHELIETGSGIWAIPMVLT